MKLIRKTAIWFLKLFIAIISLLFIYLFIALVLTLIPENSDFVEANNGTDVFVSSNGVHINLVLPVDPLSDSWMMQFNSAGKYNYLAFGWGDKKFYMNTPTWSELDVLTTLKAGFLPTPSVVQVYGLEKLPRLTKRTKKINLTNNQFKTLSSYIYNSFQLNEEGELIKLNPASSVNEFYTYYKAKGKYSLFFTCNNWASRGLKEAGIKNSVWAPFDKSVLYHLN